MNYKSGKKPHFFTMRPKISREEKKEMEAISKKKPLTLAICILMLTIFASSVEAAQRKNPKTADVFSCDGKEFVGLALVVPNGAVPNKLARKYYGNAKLWKHNITDPNNISDPTKLIAGSTIFLPAEGMKPQYRPKGWLKGIVIPKKGRPSEKSKEMKSPQETEPAEGRKETRVPPIVQPPLNKTENQTILNMREDIRKVLIENQRLIKELGEASEKVKKTDLENKSLKEQAENTKKELEKTRKDRDQYKETAEGLDKKYIQAQQDMGTLERKNKELKKWEEESVPVLLGFFVASVVLLILLIISVIYGIRKRRLLKSFLRE